MSDLIQDTRDSDACLPDRLKSIDGFSDLSDLSKKIIFEHIASPELNYGQLGAKLRVPIGTIQSVLTTKTFEQINYMIAELSVKDLLHLAIKTLRSCMACPSPAVRLAAAMAVLRNADLIKDKPDVVRQDNKIVIVWGGDKSKTNGTNLIGNSDSIYPAHEAAGNTRLNGKV